jgi:hypothetical protein
MLIRNEDGDFVYHAGQMHLCPECRHAMAYCQCIKDLKMDDNYNEYISEMIFLENATLRNILPNLFAY